MPKSEQKKEEKKPEYYNIEVEVLVPATFSYRVLAKSPDEAVRDLHKGTLISRDFKLNNVKKLAAKVYKIGTRMLELTKKF